MKATVLLCDAAQECGGKLFLLGAGWTTHNGTPVNMSLGVILAVGWDEANMKHQFRATLLTEDGGLPMLSVPNMPQQMQPVEVGGEQAGSYRSPMPG